MGHHLPDRLQIGQVDTIAAEHQTMSAPGVQLIEAGVAGRTVIGHHRHHAGAIDELFQGADVLQVGGVPGGHQQTRH